MILILLTLSIATFVFIVVMIDGKNIDYALHDDCKVELELPKIPSYDIIKAFKAFKIFTWREESE
jgi:hypothetical protein